MLYSLHSGMQITVSLITHTIGIFTILHPAFGHADYCKPYHTHNWYFHYTVITHTPSKFILIHICTLLVSSIVITSPAK